MKKVPSNTLWTLDIFINSEMQFFINFEWDTGYLITTEYEYDAKEQQLNCYDFEVRRWRHIGDDNFILESYFGWDNLGNNTQNASSTDLIFTYEDNEVLFYRETGPVFTNIRVDSINITDLSLCSSESYVKI